MIISINHLLYLGIVFLQYLSIHIDCFYEIVFGEVPLLLLLLLLRELYLSLNCIALNLHEHLTIFLILQIYYALVHFLHLVSIIVVRHAAWLTIYVVEVVSRGSWDWVEVAYLSTTWYWLLVEISFSLSLRELAIVV